VLFRSPSEVDQEILGFGGAFTEAAATTFSKLTPQMQDIVIEQYFGASGLAYTLGRVPINSCDFSVDSYSFDDTPGDFELKDFDTNLGHDKKEIIPLIRRAIEKVESTVSDTHVRLGGKVAGKWESLKVFDGIQGPGTAALQSEGGRFLSTEAGGAVTANNLKSVASTFFTLKEVSGDSVALLGANGKHLVVSKDGSVKASGDEGSGTTFVRVKNADGTISLRVPEGQYLTAEPMERLRLLASPWSPPAWMKTNSVMDGSGTPCLKGEATASWAKYLAKWISSYTAAGVPIWALSVQNEPTNNAGWEACTLTPQEEADFLGTHLGPTLKKEHPEVSIFVFDDSKHMLPDYVSAAMQQPGTAQYVQGAAFHWYSGDLFDKVAWVHQQHPEVMLLASEATYERRMWKAGMLEPYSDWRFGEGYAHDIIGDLNAGAVGWIDWNLLLDDKGGPNHIGNVCDAAVVIDAKQQILNVHPQYYYIGHFSKFLVPGSRHVTTKVSAPKKYKPSQGPGPYGTCTGEGGLEATSALRPDGQTAVVVLNCADEDIDFKLLAGSSAVKASAPRRSITTYILPAAL